MKETIDSAAAAKTQLGTSSADSVDKGQAETVLVSPSGSAVSRPSQETSELPEIFGRYKVIRLLGRGGMGSVYLAEDQQLGRSVALKIPRVHDAQSGKLLARLEREARAVAALSHPNICAVYDVGEIDGIHFLAMAYVNGRPLSEFLQSSKPQSERAIALIVFKIARALEEAHAKGILHRDLKPANIMVDGRGEPIVMDFGLSFRLEDDQSRLTHEGSVIGTPAYMSPEQIDNRCPIGPATDVYSLGVVMFELLTRRCPFEGSAVSVIGQVLHAEPPKISALRSNASPEMIAICERAMAKNPAQRYPNMKSFADALSAFIKGKTATTVVSTVPDLVAIEPLASIPDSLLASAKPLPIANRQADQLPKEVWIAGACAVGIVLLLGVFILAGNAFRDNVRISQTDEVPTSSPATNQVLPTVPSVPIVSAKTESATAETLSDDKTEPKLTIRSGTPENTKSEPIGDKAKESQPTAPPAKTSEVPATEPLLPDGEPRPPRPLRPNDNESGNEMQSIRKRFEELDHNGDQELDPQELHLHVVIRADKNRDGTVNLQELERAFDELKEKLFADPNFLELQAMKRFEKGGPGRPKGPPPRGLKRPGPGGAGGGQPDGPPRP